MAEREGRDEDAKVSSRVMLGLLHDQLNALSVLTARMSLVRESIMNRRVSLDEVKRAEEDAQWLERLTRDTLRDLTSRGTLDEDRTRLEDAALSASARWSSAMPQIELEIDVPRNLWARIPGTALGRVLQNLLMNAGRFARGKVLVNAERRGSEVLVSVHDDGPGFRGTPPSDTSGGGFGLGLDVVRWTMERFGGSVEFSESDALGGACVEVRLRPDDGEEEAVEDRPVSLEGLDVAVVDDDPNLVYVTRRILQSAGARVAAVPVEGSSETIAAELARLDAAAILLDARLGDMSGLDVLEAFENAGGDPERVIIFTGDVSQVPDGTPAAVVSKPPDWKALIKRILALGPV